MSRRNLRLPCKRIDEQNNNGNQCALNRRLYIKTKLSKKSIIAAFARLCMVVVTITICAGCNSSTPTPNVPFDGLKEKAVICDCWNECPNGDYSRVTAYQLYPVNIEKWIKSGNTKQIKWVRGSVRDKKYKKAFGWYHMNDFEHGGPPPNFPYEEWLKSKYFYFYMEDYEEFTEDELSGVVHHSSIWALDSKNYRLYNVAGCM